jgi:hypothetical protein
VACSRMGWGVVHSDYSGMGSATMVADCSMMVAAVAEGDIAAAVEEDNTAIAAEEDSMVVEHFGIGFELPDTVLVAVGCSIAADVVVVDYFCHPDTLLASPCPC